MSKETIIPAGYRLSVTSWENDADNYNTKVVEGLTKEGVALRVDLCRLLSDSHGNAPAFFGNLYEPSKEECELMDEGINKILLEHGIAEESHNAAEHGHNLLSSCGLMWSGEGFYTRVAETIKVEYIEHAIHLKDVTEEF